ncbi:MAG: hypothetical protein IKV53_07860 [Clostridia bacterium]|nr:hypothetical protein [Clostridia bacterium]
MYSRKLGMSDEQGSRSLESFNERLREQYAQKRKPTIPTVHTPEKPNEEAIAEKGSEESFNSLIEQAKSGLSNLKIGLDFESILILGLILLILSDADVPDLVLIGVLLSLIF